jgi:hypothetical protein
MQPNQEMTNPGGGARRWLRECDVCLASNWRLMTHPITAKWSRARG